ncbi:hypothetical protein FK531_21065 [Rhodococcus spelaei]|uniref:Uncharacterized protein n=1 Tax=Rhodococcus spelaei TaxID=2546320 RepID=A0A541AZU5_9NOCA|nr:hypothetical protein [Rhodococcus spelaei]TQF65591.1 hypothetical protein FK531_21065 [Rhodococcus spelaei]
MDEPSGADVAAMYEAAVAGELWLDDGVGQACAAHCQELIDELDVRAEAMSALGTKGGFGDFLSAQQLESGFARKAVEAREQLVGYRVVAERMREMFLAADRSYAAASDAHTQQLRNAGAVE